MIKRGERERIWFSRYGKPGFRWQLGLSFRFHTVTHPDRTRSQHHSGSPAWPRFACQIKLSTIVKLSHAQRISILLFYLLLSVSLSLSLCYLLPVRIIPVSHTSYSFHDRSWTENRMVDDAGPGTSRIPGTHFCHWLMKLNWWIFTHHHEPGVGCYLLFIIIHSGSPKVPIARG